MEPGQCSQASEVGGGGENVRAKLVPRDSRYSAVEISAHNLVICSETTDSSSEKLAWCEISWRPDCDSAKIRNLSSNAIIVDGTCVGEEAAYIKCGSEIISGPDRKGYLAYNFEVIPAENCDVHEKKSMKILLDVEHAKCSICLNIWHDVVTVSPCLHNFCNGCFSEWLRRSTSQSKSPQGSVLCPQCRAIVQSAGRNHFLHDIEEVILQTFSSQRSDEEIAQLDTYASVKSNHVEMETLTIPCSCGGGPMIRLQSKTQKYPNRWFLKCPLRMDHPNSFRWEDQANVPVPNEVQLGAQQGVRDRETEFLPLMARHGVRHITLCWGCTNFLLLTIVVLLYAIYVKLGRGR